MPGETEELDELSAKLRDRAQAMVDLLSDPHPGLATWLIAVVEVGTEVRDLLNRVLGDAGAEKKQ